jgi:hypothetical protein
MEHRPWYVRHPDDEIIDEIRIVTVPRYKTSELSGDEWRTSAKIEFRRKGKVLHTESLTAMKYAVQFLPYLFVRRQEDGHFDKNDKEMCFQPGCSNKATVEYRMKTKYCGKCGKEEGQMTGYEYRRRFCEEHRERGDCGRSDADDNYELIELTQE